MSASQFPPLEGKSSNKHCSNCGSKMTAYVLPGHYQGNVEIDVCMDCNAIWFDQFESMALSPDGTVALFQLIHQRGGTATKFSEGLCCVTCGEGMKLTNDQVKGARFAYQACRKGHGRMTTFYNFLAEKQFVRELTKTERAKLAAKVEQIRCSGCGAAVNIGKVDACEYCRAPVSVFDRDAAKKAIDHYLQEQQRQPAAGNDRRAGGRAAGDQWSSYDRADLGSNILYALGRAAARGVSSTGLAVPVGAGAAVTPGAFADAGGATGAALPDATSALFGADALSGAGASQFSSDALSSLASSTAEGAGGAVSGALPSVTGALFGGGGDAASLFGDVASSSVSEAATDLVSSLGDGAVEAVSGGALDVAGDMASEVASSAGEGIVDLVTDGIGSLLGSLFS